VAHRTGDDPGGPLADTMMMPARTPGGMPK
jgi:hypothetical protein